MKRQDLPSPFGRVLCPDDGWLALAPFEEPVDPTFPIVDAHLHLWHFGDCAPYFLEDYACDLAASGHNVEASVFIECNAMYRAHGAEHLRSVGETEFAVGMAAMADSHKYTTSRVAAGIVGFTDLTLGGKTQEALEAHLACGHGRFRGVRQRAKWDADPAVKGPISVDRPGLYLEREFSAGVELLTSLGLSFDASIYHPQLPDVVTLAQRHPDANIVLIHSGSPVGHSSYAGKEKENHAIWLAGMKQLAQCPNVSVKMGGILMNLANFDFTAAAHPPASATLAELWRPYIEPCIELFGAERCMVSSNFPVDKVGFGYGTVWNMFKRITAACSSDEKRMIFRDTARRVYRLDDASTI
jgi:L-fuconolactonase